MAADTKQPLTFDWSSGNAPGAELVMHQLIGLIKQVIPLDLALASNGKSFQSKPGGKNRKGICAVTGKIIGRVGHRHSVRSLERARHGPDLTP